MRALRALARRQQPPRLPCEALRAMRAGHRRSGEGAPRHSARTLSPAATTRRHKTSSPPYPVTFVATSNACANERTPLCVVAALPRHFRRDPLRLRSRGASASPPNRDLGYRVAPVALGGV